MEGEDELALGLARARAADRRTDRRSRAAAKPPVRARLLELSRGDAAAALEHLDTLPDAVASLGHRRARPVPVPRRPARGAHLTRNATRRPPSGCRPGPSSRRRIDRPRLLCVCARARAMLASARDEQARGVARARAGARAPRPPRRPVRARANAPRYSAVVRRRLRSASRCPRRPAGGGRAVRRGGRRYVGRPGASRARPGQRTTPGGEGRSDTRRGSASPSSSQAARRTARWRRSSSSRPAPSSPTTRIYLKLGLCSRSELAARYGALTPWLRR